MTNLHFIWVSILFMNVRGREAQVSEHHRGFFNHKDERAIEFEEARKQHQEKHTEDEGVYLDHPYTLHTILVNTSI